MIREATKQDSQEVVNMISDLHKESRYKAYPFNRGKVSTLVRSLIDSENGLVLLSEDKGLFVANIQDMFFSDSVRAADMIFYVKPEYRKNGIGTKMIEYYMSWAKSKEANDIMLSTSTGLPDKAVKKVADNFGMDQYGLIFGVNHVF